jgi:hypothetical protein
MMFVDIGIEPGLNAGAPAPAPGAAGTLAAAAGAASSRAGQPAAGGLESFHAALRAAAGAHHPGAAGGRPGPPAATPADRSNAAQASKGVDAQDRQRTASEADGVEFWLLLMQALQDMLAEAQAGMSRPDGSVDAAEAGTAGAEIPTEIRQFLDRLRPLRPSAGGLWADPAAAIGEAAGLSEKFKALLENSPAALSPANLDLLRRELREQLLGLAAGGQADDPGLAGTGTGKTTSVLEGGHAPGPDAQAAEAVRRPGGGLEIRFEGPGARADMRSGRPAVASGEGSAEPEGVALTHRTREPETTPAGGPSAAALRATPHPEGLRGSVPPESSRPAEVPSDGVRKVAEGGQDPPADSGDFRQAAEDLPFFKAPAALEAAPEKGDAITERFALTPREARPLLGSENHSGRSADAAATLRERETAAGSLRNGVFDQIVQRAVVQVANERGEIRIDLKPEFLGRVRMQILAENQQLSVRILTELPAARDLIETGLQQLRSDLQSHGLQVERLEVAMANDHRQQGGQQAQAARTGNPDGSAGGSAADRVPAEERWEPIYYRPQSTGAGAIDMFV